MFKLFDCIPDTGIGFREPYKSIKWAWRKDKAGRWHRHMKLWMRVCVTLLNRAEAIERANSTEEEP
jgi:hypothetical protein